MKSQQHADASRCRYRNATNHGVLTGTGVRSLSDDLIASRFGASASATYIYCLSPNHSQTTGNLRRCLAPVPSEALPPPSADLNEMQEEMNKLDTEGFTFTQTRDF
ncbi:hypothetical protein PROFUN_06054 [Planoprotostelium fungivorum]|uniref:Uncharacterized protein n=1 Tax=Planoprotostelium fungivorum TaxID=1890364 RepID=A0A2P6NPQ4_9EUKA|nr:hypothetical protein PROFUN_06054 [Planoprotostelium fungivorum]